MPGKKNDSKTPADTTQQAESAGASAPPIDLEDALVVGNSDLIPEPVRYKGIDLELCRYYPPDTVEKLADLAQRPLTNRPELPLDKQVEERLKEFRNNTREILSILFPDQRAAVDQLLEKLMVRTEGEVARIFRYMYNLAGISSPAGEFLAL